MKRAEAFWRDPPRSLDLDGAALHVWRVNLDPGPRRTGELEGLLSPAERARAGRFVFPRDRRRYVVAHGALRTILAGYQGEPAERLAFALGAHGKPRLTGTGDLRFNLSHSGELALLAVARGRELGIDLEQHRALDDLDALARTCFSASEYTAWRRLQSGERAAAFFATWTRKEAYLKALGDGLARPLGGFDVSVDAEAPARLLRDAGDPRAAETWTLRALPLEAGFAATVAFEGRATLAGWAWSVEGADADGRPGGSGPLHGRDQPRGAVLDLARRPAASRGLARAGQGRLAGRLPAADRRGLDRRPAGELAPRAGRSRALSAPPREGRR